MSELDFKATVAVCAFRDIKARALPTLFALRDCPNPKINVKIQDGDALISRSRSLVAKYFLEQTEDDILCFLDDDVIISPFDLTQLMQEAYQLKLPIVGAAYVTKSKERPGLAVRPLENEDMIFGVGGAIHEMRHVSTGCMVIRREVFEKMKKKIPLCKHGDLQYHPFFQHTSMIIDGVAEDVSEDWFFCEQARKLDFKVYCDTTIKTGHVGNYEYNFDDIANRNNGLVKTYDQVKFRMGEHKKPFFKELFKVA